MRPRTTILDLETIPQDPRILQVTMPTFDPAAAKLGNLKDPAKIEAKLKELEEKHRTAYIEDAALEASTCHIKLAGLKDANTGKVTVFTFEPDEAVAKLLTAAYPMTAAASVILYGDEGQMLDALTESLIGLMLGEKDRIVTYFGNDFDLPMIFRRLWILGSRTPVPYSWRRRRYWSERFVDIREIYTFHDRNYSTGGMRGLGKMLGLPEKTGDGAKFGELYKADPVAAVAYNIGDLDATHAIAERLGIIHPAKEEA